MTDEMGAYLASVLADAQRAMNKNLAESIYRENPLSERLKQNLPKKNLRQRLTARFTNFFSEARSRLSNAYDCLIKGVDPYEY